MLGFLFQLTYKKDWREVRFVWIKRKRATNRSEMLFLKKMLEKTNAKQIKKAKENKKVVRSDSDGDHFADGYFVLHRYVSKTKPTELVLSRLISLVRTKLRLNLLIH